VTPTTLVDRRVRVRLAGRVIARGHAIADGISGVLVREDHGAQGWWPAENVELDEVGGTDG
jgi:hypothetical protein